MRRPLQPDVPIIMRIIANLDQYLSTCCSKDLRGPKAESIRQLPCHKAVRRKDLFRFLAKVLSLKYKTRESLSYRAPVVSIV